MLIYYGTSYRFETINNYKMTFLSFPKGHNNTLLLRLWQVFHHISLDSKKKMAVQNQHKNDLDQKFICVSRFYIYTLSSQWQKQNHLVCNVKYAGSYQDKYIDVYTRRIIFHNILQIHNCRHQICAKNKSHMFNILCKVCNIFV